MWIATDFGFFSIVEKPWDKPNGLLTVRTRVRGDLVTFLQRAHLTYDRIVEDQDADYRFRAQVPRADVALVLVDTVTGLDYDNFKARVGKAQGGKRAMLYARVWGVLLDLDLLNTRPRGMTAHQAYLGGFAAEPRD